MTVRVRFAPSPTGHLHIGGMRSAIFNWLFARHHNGTFLLRIEDTDIERSKKEYTDSILASFAWMRVDWDEPVVIQSQRAGRHAEIAQMLVAQKKAYYCTCTQEQVIDRLSRKPGFDAQFIKYDGYCRNENHTAGALRFKLPSDISSITFDDLIRGTITINLDQLDDFIIMRSDGTPMYNFVVVIDDADMRISHVIRGEEHIANTPKQILLYRACNFVLPHFAHLPMILGPDGQKLSKRDAATGVHEYKEKGYLPDALFNYLVRLGWAHGDQEIFTRQELINYFTLEQVNKKGAIFDQHKLDWINGVYLRNMPDQEILDIILKDIKNSFVTDLPRWHVNTILLLINIYKQRAKTIVELIHDIAAIYNQPESYNEQDVAQWIKPETKTLLDEFIKIVEVIDPFLDDTLNHAAKAWIKTKQLKMVEIMQPLRIALMGKSSGPGVFELMTVLGKHDTIDRIKKLITFIDKN